MTKLNFNRNSTEPLEYLKELFLVSPNDSVDLNTTTRAISFSGAGALRVELEDSDAAVTIPSGALAAGVCHPLGVKRIYATGTTATGIVGYV